MSVRWVTFFLWAAVAASAVAWGLKLFVSAPQAPRDVRVADAGGALRGDMLRVLGADPVLATPEQAEAPAPVADARFQLIGVVAPRVAGTAGATPVPAGGVALIAVDGKPPKAFRVGAAVDGQTVLKSVRARGADLGPRDGAATIALEIPPPAPAATGVLPGAGGVPAGLPPPQPTPNFGVTRAAPVVGMPQAPVPNAYPGTTTYPGNPYGQPGATPGAMQLDANGMPIANGVGNGPPTGTPPGRLPPQPVQAPPGVMPDGPTLR